LIRFSILPVESRLWNPWRNKSGFTRPCPAAANPAMLYSVQLSGVPPVTRRFARFSLEVGKIYG
jgi:hypothetical protein